MARDLVWIQSENSHGFGCSLCNWKFKPSGEPGADSLDEMKRKFEVERDKEFAAHTCVKRTSPTYQMTK